MKKISIVKRVWMFGLLVLVMGVFAVSFSSEVSAVTEIIKSDNSTRVFYIGRAGDPTIPVDIDVNWLKYSFNDSQDPWKDSSYVWDGIWNICNVAGNPWSPTTASEVPPCGGGVWPFMDRGAGKAQVIQYSTSVLKGPMTGNFFRKKFSLPNNIVVTKAKLYWTSDNAAKFWINESGVGAINNSQNNDGVCSTVSYGGNIGSGINSYDVTSKVVPGNNILAANLINLYPCGKDDKHPTGLQFNLVVEYNVVVPPIPTPTPRITANINVWGANLAPTPVEVKNGYTIPVYQVLKSSTDYVLFGVNGYSNGVSSAMNLSLFRSNVVSACWIGSAACGGTEDWIDPKSQSNATGFYPHFYPKEVGSYYVAVNATSPSNSTVLCSGNPFISPYPYYGFQNCTGSNNEVSRIRINVVTPTPTPTPIPVVACNYDGSCTGNNYQCATDILGETSFECLPPAKVTGSVVAADGAPADVNTTCSFCGTPPVPTLTPRAPTFTPVPATPPHTPTPPFTPTPAASLKTWNVKVNVDCGVGKVVYVPVNAEVITDSNGSLAGGAETIVVPSGGIAQCGDGIKYSTVVVNSRSFADGYTLKVKATSTRLGGSGELYLNVDGSNTSYSWSRSLAEGTITKTFTVPTAAQSKICGPRITPEPAKSCIPVLITPITALTATPPNTPTPKPTVTPKPTFTPVPYYTPIPTPTPVLSLVSACGGTTNRTITFRLSPTVNSPNLLLLIRDAHGANNQLILNGSQSGSTVTYTYNLNPLLDGCSYPISIISARTIGNYPIVWNRPVYLPYGLNAGEICGVPLPTPTPFLPNYCGSPVCPIPPSFLDDVCAYR